MGYFFILLCLVINGWGQQLYLPRTISHHLHSAQRGPNESANAAFQRYLSRLSSTGVRRINNDTPVAIARPYSQLAYQGIPVYQSPIMTQKAFMSIRDVRYLKDSNHNMIRRSSWLFPDDGCFARAALMVQKLSQWNLLPPAKVFIFGNLSVKTKNSPYGSVDWWYHVVPIIIVGNQPIVFDPAIEPGQPMLLKDWILAMTPEINSVKLAICHPSSYTPDSPCRVDSNSSEPAMDDQLFFLNMEWNRLVEMNRNPVRELGDFPPWLGH
ncbi:MAG: hypothetical protein JNL11_19115 [Bdellovibrionaceae bacterium]|nr:hypothetical protein [Pseudobdellovibrionaceae bacterium]